MSCYISLIFRRLFLLPPILALAFPACFLANGQTLLKSGETDIPYILSGPVPSWSGGYLLPIENNDSATPVIHAFDDTGREDTPFVFSLPGTKWTRIEGVARGTEGTYAIAGRAYDQEGRGGGFISVVSPNRQAVTTVRTYPFSPHPIAIAPDGTIWVQGMEVTRRGEADPAVNPANGVVRRFDRSGKLLGSFVPRKDLDVVRPLGLTNSKLAVNKDTVGWYFERFHEYYELKFDGNSVSAPVSYPGVAARDNSRVSIDGLALMDNGDAYVSVYNYDPSPNSGQVYRLDRAKRSWVPVSVPTKPDGTPVVTQPFILGGDGSRLALVYGRGIMFLKPGN